MFHKRVGPFALTTAFTLAIFLGLSTWGSAQANSSTPTPATVIDTPLQQGTPMTGTMPADAPMQPGMLMTDTMPTGAPMQPGMPMTDTEQAGHNMPADAGAADMPMQQGEGQAGMGGMMTKMADMQRMMSRMQRMMGSDMMGGDMPMSADMQKSMGEMMSMMGDMQGMMADMQGMMAGDMMSGGMSEMDKTQGQQMGQMGGQQMGTGMMGQMPMMGTVIMVMPMPMHGGMDMGKMMGQMPMMQGGMDMGGMMQGGMMQGGMDMGGQDAPQRGGPAAASEEAVSPAAAPQTGKLGDIEVKVTPPDLSNIQGETIDFTVDLNAAGADLSFDLAKQATLLIGDHKMPADAWKVTLDHGHHVAGVLTFPAHMQGAVESATVVITDTAGGPEVNLTWPPAE